MDYKEKYEQALEKARQEYNTTENVERKHWLEELFPELSESEDESIRKALKHYLEVRRCQTNKDEEYVNCNRFLSWLEKQGEQKSVEWSDEDEKYFMSVFWHVSYSISNGKQTSIRCDCTEWLSSIRKRLKGE